MIVSTTLVGPGTIDVLDEALASVRDQVDCCLVILTDAELAERDVVHSARRAGVKRERLVVRRFDWVGDFAAARNFALEAVAELAGTWALTVDTDERLDFDGLDLRRLLAQTDTDLFLVLQSDGSYSKERIFRLGKPWRWTGRTHEALPWVVGTTRETLSGVSFSELPKTPEQLRAKFERDKLLLLEDVGSGGPTAKTARSWYYLGESHYGLGELEQAVFAFGCCGHASGWAEEAAFAHYRAAEVECKRGRFYHAVEHAGAGLVRHAGIAELGWIAGYASYKLGRFEQAIHWGMIAAGSGSFQGTARLFERLAFRYPPALWEGPFDVIANAYAALGMHEQSARALAKKRAAESLRLKAAVAT